MSVDTLRGLITLFLLIAFIALCIYAYNGKHRRRFDAVAKQVLDDDDERATLEAERARQSPSHSTTPSKQPE